jgi:protein-disulfide isomerase
MAKSSGRTAKQKAAEARAKSEASEKRRQRMINTGIGVVLAVVVLALVGGAWFASQDGKDDADLDAAIPTGTLPADSEYAFGINAAGEAAGKPVLQIWEDFQCPACGQFEAAFSSTINKIAEEGTARVIWRSTSFLDSNFPGDNSKRAAAAWGCAIDADKKIEYHDTVFANQPANEGDGWSDAQLIQIGKDVGIAEDKQAAFEQCVNDRKYVKWANNGTDEFRNSSVPGTPALYLNGEELSQDQRGTPEALEQTIKDASGEAAPAASESATKDDGQ